MIIDIHFYLEEKIKFLEEKGFEIKEIVSNMGYPCGDSKGKVWAVYRNNAEYQKPGGYIFKKEEWLDGVFKDEANKKLAKLILNE